MNENNKSTPPPGIKPGDVLHALFRQKWKILIISGLGIIATCLLWLSAPQLYQSEAKILIKYVLEGKSAQQIVANDDSQVKAVDAPGGSIINTELQVLSSLDLARQVATVIGPDKVLAKAGGGTNVEAAAALIRANLLTEVPNRSSVIQIIFQHPDREMVQPILKQVIDSYLKMHLAIHMPGGGLGDFLTQETDQLHSRLLATDDALRQAKAKAGVISLEDSKKSYTEQISRIQEAILDAEAQLAERQTSAAELAKLLHTTPVSATNQVAGSNNVAVAADKEAEYTRLCRSLDNLRKKEDEMLTYLTPESTGVKDVQAQIEAKEKLKQQMEEKSPGLLATKSWDHASAALDVAAGLRSALFSESTRVAALEAKIKVLTQQLDSFLKQATNLAAAEGSITELQRKAGLDEARYKYYFDHLDQARIDETLGAGRTSNISMIQEASPPFRAASKLLKTLALVLFGSIGAAFALAFAIEFYLDPCLKRPGEVEAKLGVPLFISIPLMRQNGNSLPLTAGKKVPLLSDKNNGNQNGDAESPPANHEPFGAEASLAPVQGPTREAAATLGDSPYAMRPFSDALRDRLINFFEARNMTHKPKLVALTSCRQGSGVSTIASGLAASLSETGDGNVLLVDMNREEGSAHQFRRGDLACGLEEALTEEKRGQAMVQDNLFVVAEGSTGDNLPRALPKRFKNLVPRLKASDFDYIIFDLPPVSQISMTPRLARFMDVVLMVIESEKTDVEVLKRGITLLHESQHNIGTVLNKRRSHVPKWLQQEF